MTEEVKYYEIKTYSDDEYYEKEITDIFYATKECVKKLEKERSGFIHAHNGLEWYDYMTEEEFMEEFEEDERKEMLEDYNA